MQYKQLSRTGLSVSRLCLGTGTFGHQTDEAEAVRILDAAVDAGVNFIDTADMYPGGALPHEVGSSEEITGRWLKGKRGRFILGTKAGGPMGPSQWDRGASRKHLLDAIDASLKRLDTDYVDLYQIHMDDPSTPLDETAEALDLIVRSGKVRYIGVSNFLAYRLARAIGRQDTLRLARFVSVQPRYNLLFREIERDLLPLAQEENLAVIPYNPLAGGLLTNRYKLDDNPDQGRFSTTEMGQFGAMYKARYWKEREFETIRQLRAIGQEIGEPLPKLAIAWIMANPAITSVILGASRTEQLTDTLAAADFLISAELKAKLDELTSVYRQGDAGR
ncbi:aldo/keto reductase [Rhizobium sp. P38BS-XIX]|uniref:aldo/keto reductase n=1 Tax=Rhizobium sp. P38BS-XIX TaxID=2726740 RepID=UPI001456E4FD|nr:aldo/keto reductase [Rhizobium sp. P38BS-XIX]NLS00484.1 aldo/keto reductase [Rhizobium sp. P38BS-XIX]